MNNQKPSNSVSSPTGDLNVVTAFSSIQGEGPFVGRPALFIRLFGCNLSCPLCDTNYTSESRRMTREDLLKETQQKTNRTKLVVITGGEPFLQNIHPLLYDLLSVGTQVQVETNGTLSLHRTPPFVTVVCSPKTPVLHPSAGLMVDYYKYVVEDGYVNPKNGLPIRILGKDVFPHAAPPPKGFDPAKVYIQPLDPSGCGDLSSKKYKENLSVAIEVCEHFGYTLGIQLHKLIGKE